MCNCACRVVLQLCTPIVATSCGILSEKDLAEAFFAELRSIDVLSMDYDICTKCAGWEFIALKCKWRKQLHYHIMRESQVKLFCGLSGINVEVHSISGHIHEANNMQIPRPTAIDKYNLFLGGVDKSDQYLAYHNILWKTVRYWKTLFAVYTVVSRKRAHGRSTSQVCQRGGWALFRLFPQLTTSTQRCLVLISVKYYIDGLLQMMKNGLHPLLLAQFLV